MCDTRGIGTGAWRSCGPGIWDLGWSSTSGLSDLLLEFGLFPWGAFVRGKSTPVVHSESLEALPLPSGLRLDTGTGHTPGPARTEDTGQGWRTPGLSFPPSLPPVRGPQSTLPSSAVKNAPLHNQGTHSAPSAPQLLLGAGHGGPPVPGTHQISQLPEESRCSTETARCYLRANPASGPSEAGCLRPSNRSFLQRGFL